VYNPPLDARKITPEKFFDRMGVPYRRVGAKITVNTVNLSRKRLEYLPDLRDVVVKGDFLCDHNYLKTLEGCPRKIKGTFDCRHSHLRSLEGGPEYVGENFYCDENDLRSLVGAPRKVGGWFGCTYNNLRSLQGSADLEIGISLDCNHNPRLVDFSVLPRRFYEVRAFGDNIPHYTLPETWQKYEDWRRRMNKSPDSSPKRKHER
jgi:hypothetical protein